MPLIYEALGRATVAEVVQAAKDWTVAHRLSLFMLTTVLVELGGGVDVALNEPHVVIFELGPPKAYDGSPSTAFKLEAGSYIHRDDLKGSVVESQWSAPATAMREAIARECRDNPDVAGLVPVTFCLRGSPIAPNTSFPLCRPRVPEGRTVDARTRAALQQLIALLSPVINDGLVLSVPTDASQIVPDMGRLVQGRKSWVWRPPLHVGAKSLAEFLRWCELKYSDPGPSPSELVHRVPPVVAVPFNPKLRLVQVAV